MHPAQLRDPLLIAIGAAPGSSRQALCDILTAAEIDWDAVSIVEGVLDGLVELGLAERRHPGGLVTLFTLTPKGEALKQLLTYKRSAPVSPPCEPLSDRSVPCVLAPDAAPTTFCPELGCHARGLCDRAR